MTELKLFLTHTSAEIDLFFSREAVQELQDLGMVVCNPLDRRLTSAELLEYAGDAEVIISEWNTGMDRSFIENAKSLKAFIRSGVEINNVDFAAAKEAGIWIVNTPGQYVYPVVELTVGLMIALNRRIVDHTTSLRSGVKLPLVLTPELYGKTLSIIGMGVIGRRLAHVADALGMRILGYDPYVVTPPEGCEMTNLDELLREADYVSLHAAHTGQAEGLIRTRELALMKPTAFLINTSRGSLIDESALYDALVSGRLAGAALDVFHNEPTIVGNRLLTLPSVVSTPHIGGFSPETMRRQAFEVVNAVKDIAANRTPRHLVNR